MKLAAYKQQSKLLYLNHCSENIMIMETDHYISLEFGNVTQSIMLKRLPSKLTLPHQYYLALPLLFITPKSIIELGLGGGNLLRFLAKNLPNAEIESIEKSSDVIDCFHQYFNPEKIPIKHTQSAVDSWLASQRAIDTNWLIFDVYLNGANQTSSLKWLSTIINQIESSAWISINLPDLTEQELDAALRYISLNKKTHSMIYFNVPQYKNIVVHLFPLHTAKMNQISSLAQYQHHRWLTLWRCGHTNG